MAESIFFRTEIFLEYLEGKISCQWHRSVRDWRPNSKAFGKLGRRSWDSFSLWNISRADRKKHTGRQFWQHWSIIPGDFLPYLFRLLEHTIYIDLRAFSLAVPPINHVGKPFPIIPFVIFDPPPFFEACLILRFPCKRSANATQALLARPSYTYVAEKLWTFRMVAMIPSSPSSGFLSCSRSCLSVWWWVRHSFSGIFLAPWVGIFLNLRLGRNFLDADDYFLG